MMTLIWLRVALVCYAAGLLYALRRMGHGDEIAVVDTNCPAA